MNYKIIKEFDGSVDIIHTKEPIDLINVFPKFTDCKCAAIVLIDKKTEDYMNKIKILQKRKLELMAVKKQDFNIY